MSDTLQTNRDTGSVSPTSAAVTVWTVAALVVAVAGLAGSLFLSLGLGLKACTLCFYQRTFMMSLVAVLGVGLALGTGRRGQLGLLALPLAVAGLGVALFHVSLELRGKLECPAGVFGLGTAPQQSLALFALLTVLVAGDALPGVSAFRAGWAVLLGGVVLGGLLAVASCTSNPPSPRPPAEEYTHPPTICRPPLTPTAPPSR
jgi:disulfide bond formation protein DsbB